MVLRGYIEKGSYLTHVGGTQGEGLITHTILGYTGRRTHNSYYIGDGIQGEGLPVHTILVSCLFQGLGTRCRQGLPVLRSTHAKIKIHKMETL